ncbi:hypothetical protein ACVITL_006545 [Rhizobium pisi]
MVSSFATTLYASSAGSANLRYDSGMSLLANFETVSVFESEPPAIFAIKLNAIECDCRSRRAANRLIQTGDTKNGVAKQHLTWSLIYFRAADSPDYLQTLRPYWASTAEIGRPLLLRAFAMV